MIDPKPSTTDIIPCCQHLRTKSQFYDTDEMRAGRGHIRVSSTATYWCARTSRPLGPDGQPGLPTTCQPGRTCHERAAED